MSPKRTRAVFRRSSSQPVTEIVAQTIESDNYPATLQQLTSARVPQLPCADVGGQTERVLLIISKLIAERAYALERQRKNKSASQVDFPTTHAALRLSHRASSRHGA